MALTFLNSQHGKKELFQPQDPDCVTLYVCGPTVYNLIHIGNGLSAVIFDVLFRLLKARYPKVIYARNITDLDDRINQAAQAQNKSITDITSHYIEAYQQDVAALGCLPPTIEPRATDYIPEMIDIVERLLTTQYAYEQDEHVLFHVPAYKDYGKLTNRSLDDMIAGARVEPASYKKHPADFVLWKPSDQQTPGWDSPWGRGRPGWHLECTAMVHARLGVNIDIHGGGQDLQFPHHENEIAQSLCVAPGSRYARYWLHNGLLRTGNAKMSKSLGNILTIRSLLQHWRGETLRYALLSGHYRSGLDWSDNLLSQAEASLDRLYRALDQNQTAADNESTRQPPACPDDISAALEDDLNTPAVLSALHQRANALFQNPGQEEAARLVAEIKAGGQLLGLCQQKPSDRFQSSETRGADKISEESIEALIKVRERARVEKNFSKADQIRDELMSQGVEIEDTEGGTQWRYRHRASV